MATFLHTDILTLDDLEALEPPTVPHPIARLHKTVKIKVLSILGVQQMLAARKDWQMEAPADAPAVTAQTVDLFLAKLTKDEATELVTAILEANGLATKANAGGEVVNKLVAETSDAFPARTV